MAETWCSHFQYVLLKKPCNKDLIFCQGPVVNEFDFLYCNKAVTPNQRSLYLREYFYRKHGVHEKNEEYLYVI